MPSKWRVQPSQVFDSCDSNANHFNGSQNLTKVQYKQLFNKALAFHSRVDHRSYKHILRQQHGTGFRDKHYQSSHDSRSLGSSTQNTTAVHSKEVGTKGHMKGRHSYNRTKGTCQERSLPKHNTIGAHKHLEQLDSPTSHISNHKGLNHDANQFNIPLCNRFESLAHLQENNNSQLQSCRDEVISCPGGTEENASKRIHKYNGQRTPTTSLSQAENHLVICSEYYHCKEQNGVEFGCVLVDYPIFGVLESLSILSLMIKLGGFI